MNINVDPGKYVVAVSGGVDSVVLLDLLSKQPGTELIVAHFDHGIRPDSLKDRKFVEKLAAKYSLSFNYAEGRLGPSASEALAREARYKFLRTAAKKHQADAIITAHHQDDLIETAILNLLRGTGRRGLSSLKSTGEIRRPLLAFSKKEIISYAQEHNLKWHEDPTNQDEKYFRNYIRIQIVARLSVTDRTKLLKIIEDADAANHQIDAALEKLLDKKASANLDRQWFANLPNDVSKEVMLAWLRANGIREATRKRLEQIVVAAKTYKINSQIDVNKLYIIKVGKKFLALAMRDR